MAGMEWILELALVGLLAATLFHAVRLERALGVLKHDRVQLQELIAGFNASTRQAEVGIERLRAAADGAGQQIAQQVDAALVAEGRPDAADRAWRPAGRSAGRAGPRRHGRSPAETPRLTVVADTMPPNHASAARPSATC